MQELFIYYRVEAAHAAEAQARIRQWQRELRSAHTVLCDARLLMRPDARDGCQTWMETCALSLPAGDAVAARLHALLAQGPADLPGRIDGQRHLEVFVPCA